MAAIALADIVCVRLYPNKETALFKILNNAFSGLVTVKSLILSAVFVDNGAVVENGYDLEVVAQSHFKVVGIVGGGNLNNAGSEFGIDIAVGHDGNFPSHQRQGQGLTHQRLISFVVGMNRNGGIAQ